VSSWPAGTARRAPLIVAGTGSNNTRHSALMTERATDLGADAILSVTPYYNKPNRRGLVAHYRAIGAATDKPVILYNIPSRRARTTQRAARRAGPDRAHRLLKQSNNDNLH